MKFYTKTYPGYCKIDSPTKIRHLGTPYQGDTILLYQNLPNKPQAFLKAIQPFREELIQSSSRHRACAGLDPVPGSRRI